eukprot:g19579.t1
MAEDEGGPVLIGQHATLAEADEHLGGDAVKSALHNKPHQRGFAKSMSVLPRRSVIAAAKEGVSTPYNVQHKVHVGRDMTWLVSEDQAVQDQFELFENLGQGAFAKVYRGIHKASGFEMAIKLTRIDPDFMSLTEIKAEVETLRECRQKNIVGYFGCFGPDEENQLWILMEYCAHGALLDFFTRTTEVNERQFAYVCACSLAALKFLHARGFVHRDIKGGNLMISDTGVVKICDFGMTYHNTQSEDPTFGTGSPHWMAPEVHDMKSHSAASDIWSLGITMIECVTKGTPPHSELSMKKLRTAIINSDPPGLPKQGRVWSKEFEDFVAKCLIKDPQKRPSAAELQNHPFVKDINLDQPGGVFGYSTRKDFEREGRAFRSVVGSTHTETGKGKRFTSYTVVTEALTDFGALPFVYVVRRRYNHFFWLRERLQERFPNCVLPPLPRKRMDKFNQAVIAGRQQGFQFFLEYLSKHPELSTEPETKAFVRMDPEGLERVQLEHRPLRVERVPIDVWDPACLPVTMYLRELEPLLVRLRNHVFEVHQAHLDVAKEWGGVGDCEAEELGVVWTYVRRRYGRLAVLYHRQAAQQLGDVLRFYCQFLRNALPKGSSPSKSPRSRGGRGGGSSGGRITMTPSAGEEEEEDDEEEEEEDFAEERILNWPDELLRRPEPVAGPLFSSSPVSPRVQLFMSLTQPSSPGSELPASPVRKGTPQRAPPPLPPSALKATASPPPRRNTSPLFSDDAEEASQSKPGFVQKAAANDKVISKVLESRQANGAKRHSSILASQTLHPLSQSVPAKGRHPFRSQSTGNIEVDSVSSPSRRLKASETMSALVTPGSTPLGHSDSTSPSTGLTPRLELSILADSLKSDMKGALLLFVQAQIAHEKAVCRTFSEMLTLVEQLNVDSLPPLPSFPDISEFENVKRASPPTSVPSSPSASFSSSSPGPSPPPPRPRPRRPVPPPPSSSTASTTPASTNSTKSIAASSPSSVASTSVYAATTSSGGRAENKRSSANPVAPRVENKRNRNGVPEQGRQVCVER